MRYSAFSLLALPALALASPVQEAQSQSQASATVAVPDPTPVPDVLSAPAPGEAWSQEASVDDAKQLELRQATEQDLVATLATTAVPDVTSYWIASTWNSALSSEIWVDAVYTQTYAPFPGQWTTAGAGTIGLGSHTGVVGVVKEKSSGAASVMPQGSLVTVAIGLAGMGVGMAAVLL